jgi:hypothetical protein
MNKKRYLLAAAIVAAAVLLSVLFYPMLANHRPVARLGVQSGMIRPGESRQIICVAADADGDELTYNWSATGGEISGQGAAVTWTAPGSAGFYDVTVTVSDGRGGEVTSQITIEVRANRPPSIARLIADAAWALPSGSIRVTCNASDPDGDELRYEWTASGGNIAATGAAANWTAPQEVGVHNITVVVSDGYGGSDTRTLPVTVVTGQPPVIEELRITKDRYGHCYLKKSSSGYYVGQGKMYDLECVVADAGTALSYEWSYTGGVLSGDGGLVSWPAPDKSGKVTITVTVSDIAGNMASKSLVLSVVSCSACTFGC